MGELIKKWAWHAIRSQEAELPKVSPANAETGAKLMGMCMIHAIPLQTVYPMFLPASIP